MTQPYSLGGKVEIIDGLLDVVTQNDATKKFLSWILEKIERKDLQEKVSQYFLKQLIG